MFARGVQAGYWQWDIVLLASTNPGIRIQSITLQSAPDKPASFPTRVKSLNFSLPHMKALYEAGKLSDNDVSLTGRCVALALAIDTWVPCLQWITRVNGEAVAEAPGKVKEVIRAQGTNPDPLVCESLPSIFCLPPSCSS